MKSRFFITLFSIQALHAFFAYPNALVLTPTGLSVYAIIIALIPLFFIAIRFYGPKSFWLGGLSGIILILPPNVNHMMLPEFPIVGFLFAVIMTAVAFLLFGAMVWLISLVNRHHRWLFVLAAASLFTSFEFIRPLVMATWNLAPLSGMVPGVTLLGLPPLVQMVAITGNSGAAFFLALIASWLVFMLYEKMLKSEKGREWLWIRLKVQPLSESDYRKASVSFVSVLSMMLTIIAMGNIEAGHIRHLQTSEELTIRPALVQTNYDISKELVWNRQTEYRVIKIIRELITKAKEQEADVLQFSGNTVPGYLPQSVQLWTDLQSIFKEVNLRAVLNMMSLSENKRMNIWFYLDSQAEVKFHYVKRSCLAFYDSLPGAQALLWFSRITGMNINHHLIFIPPALQPAKNVAAVPGIEEKLFNIFGSLVALKVNEEIYEPHYFREAVLQGAEMFMLPQEFYHSNYILNDYQALAVARLRAVESRRWMGWIASMGFGAFIDALGEVKARSHYNQKDILVQTVPIITYKTFYAKYGEIFTCLIGLFAIGMVIFTGIQRLAMLRQRG